MKPAHVRKQKLKIEGNSFQTHWEHFYKLPVKHKVSSRPHPKEYNKGHFWVSKQPHPCGSIQGNWLFVLVNIFVPDSFGFCSFRLWSLLDLDFGVQIRPLNGRFVRYSGDSETELRSVPKCLKHPAGPGQKLIQCRDIKWWKYCLDFGIWSC